MELIFLRHGLAVDKEEWKGEDEARPLTAEGVERTKEVVRGLRALKVCPDVILSSPLLRARETAEIAKKGLSSDAKVELADELTPSAAPDRLIARLADLAEKPVVLCVGDRKSTRLNSSHGYISYAVFCLKKKKKNETPSCTR